MALFQKPVIETERLLLRRWTMQDMAGFLRFAADPGVMMAAGARPVLSPEEARAELKRSAEDPYNFAMVLKSTGEVVGKIKYQNDLRRLHVNSVSVAYEMARQYWGHGYMTEALRGMVRHAFEVMQVDVVGISHFAENARSRRVIERVGFYREGLIPRAFRRFDGVVFDEMSYSLLKEEYYSGAPADIRHII